MGRRGRQRHVQLNRVAVNWSEDATEIPPVGGVPLEVVRQEARPALRRAAVRGLEAIRNVLYVAHKQRAEPPEQLWEIPEGEERAILDQC